MQQPERDYTVVLPAWRCPHCGYVGEGITLAAMGVPPGPYCPDALQAALARVPRLEVFFPLGGGQKGKGR